MLIKGRKRSSGFTLVELMIVVAIIGILAAIAIPAFSRYIKRSKTTEAVGHLNKLFAGSVTYYETDHVVANLPVAKQFPYTAGTGEVPIRCCTNATQKCAPGVQWNDLTFSMADYHNYAPQYTSANTGTNATFTADSMGDLDCDNVIATFQRTGSVNAATGDVSSSPAAAVTNELE